ncbi:hypothetical protein AVEN_184826-1 [Araneus ventricosus]|uniref:Uncharacterized protein n=1 Tax=Araneus ventricosus TaxID=182803 RepID=A0A4Y2J2Q2_ARAVE|nr:hypothetical protein AVEN_184826-1 [Araneus ventricosus]
MHNARVISESNVHPQGETGHEVTAQRKTTGNRMLKDKRSYDCHVIVLSREVTTLNVRHFVPRPLTPVPFFPETLKFIKAVRNGMPLPDQSSYLYNITSKDPSSMHSSSYSSQAAVLAVLQQQHHKIQMDFQPHKPLASYNSSRSSNSQD